MTQVLRPFGDPAHTLQHLVKMTGQSHDVAEIDERSWRTSGSSGMSALDDEVLDTLSTTSSQRYDSHCLSEAKILGVHKKERPKGFYFFVIAVKWSDDSQVTIYRTLKEIKALQKNLLTESKQGSNKESRRYLKKLTRRISGGNRAFSGTMERLRMIDSLNNYFEAIIYYENFKQAICVQEFFRPHTNDLNSVTWSGEGRTFFYVARDLLAQRNLGMDENDNDGDCETNRMSLSSGTRSPQRLQSDSEGFLPREFDFSDPNITWPVQPILYVAQCDFENSDDDKKENIISLHKGEQVEVMAKYESGWWLVKKPDDQNQIEPSMECGYVPATHLAPKGCDGNLTSTRPQKVMLLTSDENTTTLAGLSNDGSLSEDSSERKITCDSPVFHTQSDDSSVADNSDEENFSSKSTEANVRSSATLLNMYYEELRSSPKRNSLATVVELSDSEEDNSSAFTLSVSCSSSLDSLSLTGKDTNRPPISSPTARKYRRPLRSDVCSVSTLSRLDKPETFGQTYNASYIKPSRSFSNYDAIENYDNRRHTIGASLPNIARLPLSSVASNASISAASSSLFLSQQPIKRSQEYISNKKYAAMRSDELSFKEDAVITVLQKNPDGWWLARYQGKEGLVPGVYLRRYNDPLRTIGMHVLKLM